jgi:hypothetical protein
MSRNHSSVASLNISITRKGKHTVLDLFKTTPLGWSPNPETISCAAVWVAHIALQENRYSMCSSIYYFWGASKSQNQSKQFKRKQLKSKQFKKKAIQLLSFHQKESDCLLRDFLLSFCETLLCVEQLLCIFEMFGPLHIISHKRRRKQTTNRGLPAGLRCRVSYFSVWCEVQRA